MVIFVGSACIDRIRCEPEIFFNLLDYQASEQSILWKNPQDLHVLYRFLLFHHFIVFKLVYNHDELIMCKKK